MNDLDHLQLGNIKLKIGKRKQLIQKLIHLTNLAYLVSCTFHKCERAPCNLMLSTHLTIRNKYFIIKRFAKPNIEQ